MFWRIIWTVPSVQVISRLGITVLPIVPSSAVLQNHCSRASSPHHCSNEVYCYNCNKQLCRHCAQQFHHHHQTEDFERVKSNLGLVLQSALTEIKEKMKSLDEDIKRIKIARHGERIQKRKVRREVVTYHEGFSQKFNNDYDNNNLGLFGEELTLEQYYLDLSNLCHQIENISSLNNCVEMVK